MQQRIAPSPFGMGWFVFDGPASGVVFHGGGMDGVSTVIVLVPAQRLVVVGLCSTMIDLPGRAAAEIIHPLVPGVHIEPPIPPTVAPEPIPSSLTGEWVGELVARL
jgi:CubicO group peptidase (beta-lactamase class C family)